MLSIGVLGFIVWSYTVALPYCEVGVTNLAICWNSLTLVGTFNSKNSTSLLNQQVIVIGNRVPQRLHARNLSTLTCFPNTFSGCTPNPYP